MTLALELVGYAMTRRSWATRRQGDEHPPRGARSGEITESKDHCSMPPYEAINDSYRLQLWVFLTTLSKKLNSNLSLR